jgi:hypothetical protein
MYARSKLSRAQALKQEEYLDSADKESPARLIDGASTRVLTSHHLLTLTLLYINFDRSARSRKDAFYAVDDL